MNIALKMKMIGFHQNSLRLLLNSLKLEHIKKEVMSQYEGVSLYQFNNKGYF